MTDNTAPTPKQRLDATREALLQHMYRNQREAQRDDAHDEAEEAEYQRSHAHSSGPLASVSALWHTATHAAKAWWDSHPAHMAVDVAQPFIGKYGKTHPLKLLGIAAGLGAAVVLARPWRLISFTGLAVAALKSTQFTGLVSSMLASKNTRDPKPRDARREERNERAEAL
ncbi:MAG: hypothetical protein V4731_14595 [Pseudomonadota bacterium]